MTKINKVNEYNTLTGTYEDIEVTEEVFNYYRRSNWNIEKNNRKHAYNSIPFCALVRNEESVISNFSEFASEKDNPEFIAAKNDELNTALQILDKCLTPIQRQRFIQHYYEGLSTRQIADIEGVNQRSVMDSLAFAKKKIRNLKNIL